MVAIAGGTGHAGWDPPRSLHHEASRNSRVPHRTLGARRSRASMEELKENSPIDEVNKFS
eukprot:2664901-Heterocapsa_arctica.AAC.1